MRTNLRWKNKSANFRERQNKAEQEPQTGDQMEQTISRPKGPWSEEVAKTGITDREQQEMSEKGDKNDREFQIGSFFPGNEVL